MKKFTIKTIGCKVNTYESNVIKEKLLNAGFEYIDIEDKNKYVDLDYYIVNTCSVTHIADKKSRQMLHSVKKYNKNVKVIAIGCLVDSLNIKSLKDGVFDSNYLCDSNKPNVGADYYFSNKEKNKLVDFLISLENNLEDENVGVNEKNQLSKNQQEKIIIKYNCDPKNTYDENFTDQNVTKKFRIRSFIKIQDGCDEYCTYCLIPYLRGHIKSRDENEIIEEIKEHIKNGVKEVVLTGIHISSYGLDKVKVAGDTKISYESTGAIEISRNMLLSLIVKIANLKVEVDGKLLELERIRLGSLEPRIIDEKFIKILAGVQDFNEFLSNEMQYSNSYEHYDMEKVANKFCPSFALSLQSGSDKTLKRMNRHYTAADFENACNIIREYMRISTITTDVIVGFPGETDDDYEESLAFVKKMRFYNPNIFPYSVRLGTVAANYPERINQQTKHERTIKMIRECEIISKEIEKEIADLKEKKYGKNYDDVLVEEIIEKDSIKYEVGYTKEYIKRSKKR
ncbi:MAG: radical SAM protein [Lachnospiraceae bacterium]|nr:radical SAM protein [Lachnospiraceae bacterium]